MFRRYLFLGLTFMLATVLVYLVIQSRRNEREAAKRRTTEVLVESPVSATRAISPGDLSAGKCAIRLITASSSGRADGSVDIEISNSGSSAYQDLMLKVSLLGRSGAVIETRQRLLREKIAAHGSISAAMIPLDEVPAGVAGCRAEVLYADVKPAGDAERGN